MKKHPVITVSVVGDARICRRKGISPESSFLISTDDMALMNDFSLDVGYISMQPDTPQAIHRIFSTLQEHPVQYLLLIVTRNAWNACAQHIIQHARAAGIRLQAISTRNPSADPRVRILDVASIDQYFNQKYVLICETQSIHLAILHSIVLQYSGMPLFPFEAAVIGQA